jgi:hypothetical protein
MRESPVLERRFPARFPGGIIGDYVANTMESEIFKSTSKESPLSLISGHQGDPLERAFFIDFRRETSPREAVAAIS